jgi:hypothetical protein
VLSGYLRILRQFDGQLWDDLRMRVIYAFGRLQVRM